VLAESTKSLDGYNVIVVGTSYLPTNRYLLLVCACVSVEVFEREIALELYYNILQYIIFKILCIIIRLDEVVTRIILFYIVYNIMYSGFRLRRR